MNGSGSQRVLDEIARLREQEGLQDVADLLGELLVDDDSTPGMVRAGVDLTAAMREERIVLSVVPLVLEQLALGQRRDRVVDCVSGYLELSREAGENLKSLPPDELEEMVRGLPEEPGKMAARLADAAGIPPTAASLILMHTAAPFYRAHARANWPGDDALALWRKGSCPVCGASPHCGMLMPEGGARVLECWLCSARWGYPRMSCPYCDHTRQDDLGFFCLDGDSNTRVYFCRQCSAYLKAVDCRHLGREVVLSVVGFATLVHDLAACQQGFRPGSGLRLTC